MTALHIQAHGIDGYVVTAGGVTHRVLWDERRPECDCGVAGCIGVRAATARRAEEHAAAHPSIEPRLKGLV